MIKAVFFDVDGTLYSSRMRTIYPETQKAVQKLRRKGIRSVICTGRHLLELEELPVLQCPFDGYITLNGQICLDENFEIYDADPITGKDRDTLIRIFNEREIPVMLVEKDRLYLNCFNEMIQKAQDAMATPSPVISSYQGADIYLASAFLMPEDQKLLMRNFEGLKSVRWHPYGIDILPDGCGKMKGIRAFLRKYGLQEEETMAFGDAENDIDMIRFAKIGIAMGNADKEVKEAADYVTDDVDHNGIVSALQHFSLLDD